MFTIPDNLTRFSVQGLQELLKEASTEFNTLLAEAQSDPDAVTDETLDRLDALKAFTIAADAQIEALQSQDGTKARRADRLATFAAADKDDDAKAKKATSKAKKDDDADDDDSDDDTADEPAAAKKDPSTKEKGAGLAKPDGKLSLTDIAGNSKAIEPDEILDRVETPKFASLVASADVPGFASGQELNVVDVAAAFLAKSGHFESLAKGRHQGIVNNSVAILRREYPAEFAVVGDSGDQAVLQAVSNEARLPGGSLLRSEEARRKQLAAEGRDSLVAAGGWCAPSETVYDTCFQTTTDGMLDVPEVVARRGGIRHNTGLDWSTIYGNANTNILTTNSGDGPPGFFNLTEAEVIAGSPTKSCLQVACPSFTDTRLGVTGICLTSPILTNRGYPEFVATFVQGAMAVHAHQINALRIAAIEAGSTGVTLAATDPFTSDGSVTSNLLAGVELAITDMRYRLRLARNSTLEVVLPFWVLAQMRADLSRRTGTTLDHLSVTDGQITSWFSQRGARVQFVYDWQDVFTAGAGSGAPGGTTAITALPATTKFLVYPAGTWVAAVQDVITLSAVYDSTLLATNMVTQLFTEDGWAMLQMCPISRVYTVPTCPSGSTTAPVTVDCTTPA
jgi:hypothetical protein